MPLKNNFVNKETVSRRALASVMFGGSHEEAGCAADRGCPGEGQALRGNRSMAVLAGVPMLDKARSIL